MPITKSAKKALRQNKRRRLKNLRQVNVLKQKIKKFKGLITENKKEEAKKLIPEIYSAIDKAAKCKVIKKNTANRKKSRLIKLLNKSEKASPNTQNP